MSKVKEQSKKHGKDTNLKSTMKEVNPEYFITKIEKNKDPNNIPGSKCKTKRNGMLVVKSASNLKEGPNKYCYL